MIGSQIRWFPQRLHFCSSEKTDCIISIIRYNTRDRIGREDICYGYTSAAFASI